MPYIKLIQIKDGFHNRYELVEEDRIIATSSVPAKIGTRDIFYLVDGTLKYHLMHHLAEELGNVTRTTSKRKLMQFDIYNEHSDKVGMINSRRTKGIWKCYKYDEINFYNKNYIGYKVGMGAEGHKYPIYENDKQIALVEKDNLVLNRKDVYHIYTLEEELIELVALYCLRLDTIEFSQRDIAINSKEKSLSYTWNKEVKCKYDPDFKNRCI
ncbi:hypothetical protein [Anaeromicropila herbilytica]|uniref:Uncharacterized protein n=1 Tax=Anaeromicropila herbilytica TaxID=2785025 RepID=A0A7R7EJR5_9FIRM|nr:hypothetical protein [Anaeromicropila herbilytica]BCN29975.1 hypothetical protein bsdtb5_12700 [Anaeromicropila herbilytica]